MKEGERLFAFVDDIYVVCAERAGEVYLVLEQQLREEPGINIHQGKTKLRNRQRNLKRFCGEAIGRCPRPSMDDFKVEGPNSVV